MEQLSIFDLLAESKPLPSNIKLLSLFSGIGAFEKALDNLGIAYELVGYCEIDKYASKSYSAIHGVSEDKNLGDVTKVDEKALPKDIDLITYGFPCQDISLAGKQKGLFNEDGSKTRSGLFFDALRIIEETQPKVAIAENVKNLVGKKFKEQFEIVLASLEAAGYNNYWQVLNAKDYGVPQNRERVFIVSIRKDIDKGYTFPKGFPLEKRLKDVLEETVDEKYYLDGKFDFITKINQPKVMVEPKVIGGIGEKKSNDGRQWYQQDRVYDDGVAISVTTGFQPYYATQEPAVNVVGRINSSQDGVVVSSEGIAPTHTAGHGNTPKIIEEPTIHQVGQIYPNSGNPQAGRIYDANGISTTIDTCSGGNRMPKVALAYDEQNKYVRKDGTVGTLTTDGSSPKHNNRVLVWDGYNQRIRADQSCVGTLTQNCGADLKRNGQGIIEPAVLQLPRGKNKGGIKEISPTLTSNAWEQNNFCAEKQIQGSLRIRKLTPKECWRLMGFDDSDFHKAELVNSNTQLYKQAGNSIVVDVLEYILKQIFKAI